MAKAIVQSKVYALVCGRKIVCLKGTYAKLAVLESDGEDLVVTRAYNVKAGRCESLKLTPTSRIKIARMLDKKAEGNGKRT